MTKSGFAAINSINNPGTSGVSKTVDALNLANITSVGRVISIILDDTHPDYAKLGGPKAIGAVELVDVKRGTFDYSVARKNQNYKVAYPLYPGIKNYPVVNEIVYIITQPGKNLTTDTSNVINYYISVVNLWNHPHHTGLPYSAGSYNSANSKNYSDTALGSTNKLTSTAGTIKFGEYFKERSNIFPFALPSLV